MRKVSARVPRTEGPPTLRYLHRTRDPQSPSVSMLRPDVHARPLVMEHTLPVSVRDLEGNTLRQ